MHMHHSKLAAGCPIQAMGSAEGAVDAPPGTDAVTVVDRLAAPVGAGLSRAHASATA